MKSVEIYIDGASRGNPGPSGIGIIFYDENKNIVKKLFKFIGNTTNNIAEYTALIYSLQQAIMDKYEKVIIKSDSELLTKQLRGEYRVKNNHLKPYYDQFLHLSNGFKELKVITIDRAKNNMADRLANKAIDSRIDSSLKTE